MVNAGFGGRVCVCTPPFPQLAEGVKWRGLLHVSSTLLTLVPLPFQISSSYTTTTTITAPPSRILQNGGGKLEKPSLYLEGDIRPEIKDDIYDPSYKDPEGPKPKVEYVWRNIILMFLLHVGALYGITLVPSCKTYTLLWGKRFSCASTQYPRFSLLL